MAQTVFAKLHDRALIHVTGGDAQHFLQGLITQDITLLEKQDLIYSCLLTPNGKFLFDFFIFQDGDKLTIDCEGGTRATNLLQRLSMFKLRSDVELKLEDNIGVYQIFNGEKQNGLKDPRFDGYRAYSKPDNLNEVEFDVWDEYRIKHEIPDGSRDMIPEKSFIHESEIISKTAVSYDKGCYMGQELVSRMHHRGLIKKQLRCVNLEDASQDIELRSGCNRIGLALIRL